MTLSVKNKQRGWVYLVCARAKTKAGCSYKSIRYQVIENAIRERTDELLSQCPPPDNDRALGKELFGLEQEIDIEKEKGADLLDALTQSNSQLIRERITEVEERLAAMQASRLGLLGMIEQATGPSIARRVLEARTALTVFPLDKQKVNKACRELFAQVVVDYPNGSLDFYWHHSPEPTSITYG